MKRRHVFTIAVTAFLAVSTAAIAASGFNRAKAHEFDPSKTFLVQAEWLDGIGCPTNARVEEFIPPDFTDTRIVRFTDPACPIATSPGDRKNEGLLLAKTGPTNNNASAGADLKNVKGITLTELGYDLRKPGANNDDARGSHCGAGAPRFNVETETAFYFIGCNSPEPTTTNPGMGYMRLTWGGSAPLMGFNRAGALVPITGRVKSIEVILDEGYDAGPDNFGLAVLDNINVNGKRVGDESGGDDDSDDDT